MEEKYTPAWDKVNQGEFNAEDIKNVKEKIPELIADFSKKATKVAFIKKLILRVKLLYSMILDPDFKLDWKFFAVTIAALAYFINPFDIVSDFIPILGLADDAYVFAMLWHVYSGEIERYVRYKGFDWNQYS